MRLYVCVDVEVSVCCCFGMHACACVCACTRSCVRMYIIDMVVSLYLFMCACEHVCECQSIYLIAVLFP